MTAIAFLSLLFSPWALGETTLDFCQSEIKAKIERRFPVPEDVNYFMRGAPEAGLVGFATDSGNRILNLATGQIENIAGKEDPVPSPDGHFVTVPGKALIDPLTKRIRTVTEEEAKSYRPHHFTNAMIFYAKNSKGEYQPFFSDDKIYRNYQSVGRIKKWSNGGLYRVLFEQSGGVQFRDYEYRWENGPQIKPVSDNQYVCGGGFKFLGSTPMLNKSGTEFAAYIWDEDVTKVFEIDAANRQCKVKEQIAGLVGKMDFSPNNQFLAFHLDEANVNNERFRTPDKRAKLGIFLYDRNKKRMIPIQHVANEDSYYPVFMDDETIAFISAGKGEGRKFFVNVVKIGAGKSLGCTNCEISTKKGQFAALLGYRLNKICHPHMGYTQLQGFTFNVGSYAKMTPPQCVELVRFLGSPEAEVSVPDLPFVQKKFFKKVKLKDLMKFCQPDSAPAEASSSKAVR